MFRVDAGRVRRESTDDEGEEIPTWVVVETELVGLPIVVVEEDWAEGLADELNARIVWGDLDSLKLTAVLPKDHLVASDFHLHLGRQLEGLVLLILWEDGLQSASEFDTPIHKKCIKLLLQFRIDLQDLTLHHDDDPVVLLALNWGFDLHADAEWWREYMEPTSSRQGW